MHYRSQMGLFNRSRGTDSPDDGDGIEVQAREGIVAREESSWANVLRGLGMSRFNRSTQILSGERQLRAEADPESDTAESSFIEQERHNEEYGR